MMDLVIYSAVIAGIMSSLPAVRVKLVVFDTSVVDLTHLAHDPVEVPRTVTGREAPTSAVPSPTAKRSSPTPRGRCSR